MCLKKEDKTPINLQIIEIITTKKDNSNGSLKKKPAEKILACFKRE